MFSTDSISYNDFCDIMRKEKPPSEDSLLKAFKCIDKNGDGFITFDELFNLLTKVSHPLFSLQKYYCDTVIHELIYCISMFYLQQGERMTKSEVQAILDDADTNNDGKLDYIEVKCDNSHLMLPCNNIVIY